VSSHVSRLIPVPGGANQSIVGLSRRDATWVSQVRGHERQHAARNRRKSQDFLKWRATTLQDLDMEFPVLGHAGNDAKRRRRRVARDGSQPEQENRCVASGCQHLQSANLLGPNLRQPGQRRTTGVRFNGLLGGPEAFRFTQTRRFGSMPSCRRPGGNGCLGGPTMRMSRPESLTWRNAGASNRHSNIENWEAKTSVKPLQGQPPPRELLIQGSVAGRQRRVDWPAQLVPAPDCRLHAGRQRLSLGRLRILGRRRVAGKGLGRDLPELERLHGLPNYL